MLFFIYVDAMDRFLFLIAQIYFCVYYFFLNELQGLFLQFIVDIMLSIDKTADASMDDEDFKLDLVSNTLIMFICLLLFIIV